MIILLVSFWINKNQWALIVPLNVFSALQSNRLNKILESVGSVHDLCSVLGTDFVGTVTEVHPSLDDSVGVQAKSISDETLSKLSKIVIGLQEEKSKRFTKVNLQWILELDYLFLSNL